MMDFTLKEYRLLLKTLRARGYAGLTFAEYVKGERPERYVILRHDVDLLPANSLAVARLEKEEGMKASYYFRAVPESWDEDIIKKIAALGHEVGYHYESLTTCKGDMADAYRDFAANLTRLRALAPVETICMHGSPRSPWDSRDIWKSHSYRDLGILGEPYFDIDFADVLYLTDTGRRWDGFKVSMRDRIPAHQDRWCAQGLVYHSTGDIIAALQASTIPQHLMLTTHPQRWADKPLPWLKELVLQNAKNVVKREILRFAQDDKRDAQDDKRDAQNDKRGAQNDKDKV